MTKIVVQPEIAAAIASADGIVELVDHEGRSLGRFQRPPTTQEIERARERTKRRGERVTLDGMLSKFAEQDR